MWNNLHHIWYVLQSLFQREWKVRYGSFRFAFLLVFMPFSVLYFGKLMLVGWTLSEISPQFYAGLSLWMLFFSSVSNAVLVANSYRDILNKFAINRHYFVGLSILLSFIDFAAAAGLSLFIFHIQEMPALPFIVFISSTLLIVPFLVGLHYLIFTISFQFRRFRFALPLLLLLMFVVTPFYFPNTPSTNHLHLFNPMYAHLSFWGNIFNTPTDTYALQYTICLFAWSAILLPSSIVLFRKVCMVK